jgi:hypothetical protein
MADKAARNMMEINKLRRLQLQLEAPKQADPRLRLLPMTG